MSTVLRYSRVQRAHCSPAQAFRPIQRIGGHTGWYFANWLWRTRGFMDRCVGGVGFRRDQRGPENLKPGDILDFWRVETFEPGRLLRLAAEAKMPGRGWLEFEVEGAEFGSSVRLLALFEPDGLVGYVYWYSLYPVHWLIFRGMLRAIVREMGTCGEARFPASQARSAASGDRQTSLARPRESSSRTRRSDPGGDPLRENPDSVFRPRQREKPAPCQAECPNCGDIRGWIGLIAQRSKTGLRREDAYARAWQMITDVNPFPAVLGRICPHPCESGCNRSEKDGAVAINALERFLGDWAISSRLPLERLDPDPKPESIGVIGAGPSGLSFAYQMARRGYCVTVYDEHDQAGGMLRHGIPDYRLPPEVLDREIQRILDLGVELQLGTRVGRDVTVAQLRERHDVLFLGVGAQRSRPMDIPGFEGPGAWTGVQYLARVNRGEAVDLGRHVVVVGGGDTAVDAARTARRAGSDVTILYRRSRGEMPADPGEVEDAQGEGIRIRFLSSPIGVERRDGQVAGVVVRRNELGAPDASGRRRPVPIAGSEEELPADSVIAAVSQEPDWRGLESFHGDGRWLVSSEAGQVGDGVWAGGDVLGLGIAGMAIFHGRRAAERVHADLREGGSAEEAGSAGDRALASTATGGRGPAAPGPNGPILADSLRLDLYAARPRVQPGRLSTDEALTRADAEVGLGLTEEQFLAEVERCLSCGKCFGCEHCFMYCTPLCFSRVEQAEPGSYFALALERCEECGKCVEICPSGFLELR